MKKLISMTDFVLEQKRPIPSSDLSEEDYYYKEWLVLDRVVRYSKFLKQPLKLEFFVPCDEDGNVLEEPFNQGDLDYFYEKKDKYEKAKNKVLFEGFKMISKSQIEYTWGKILILNFSNKNVRFNFIDYTKESKNYVDVKTIECFQIAHELKLTKSAIKQIMNL